MAEQDAAVVLACAGLLEALENRYGAVSQEVRATTPLRMARAYRELLGTAAPPGEAEAVLGQLFHEEHEELVLVRAIPFAALCEHHLLPFTGHAHVAYIPARGRVVGLSKLVRLVRACGGMTIQERMTSRIADTLTANDGERSVKAAGAMVVVEATHTCMTIRGVKAAGTITTTSAVRGVFKEQPATRAEFMALIRDGR